ncbi:hypothetical protein E2320_000523 [Naja naja]|nr:hypothetical protein E2320_000523 [Naja naja]
MVGSSLPASIGKRIRPSETPRSDWPAELSPWKQFRETPRVAGIALAVHEGREEEERAPFAAAAPAAPRRSRSAA